MSGKSTPHDVKSKTDSTSADESEQNLKSLHGELNEKLEVVYKILMQDEFYYPKGFYRDFRKVEAFIEKAYRYFEMICQERTGTRYHSAFNISRLLRRALQRIKQDHDKGKPCGPQTELTITGGWNDLPWGAKSFFVTSFNQCIIPSLTLSAKELRRVLDVEHKAYSTTFQNIEQQFQAFHSDLYRALDMAIPAFKNKWISCNSDNRYCLDSPAMNIATDKDVQWLTRRLNALQQALNLKPEEFRVHTKRGAALIRILEIDKIKQRCKDAKQASHKASLTAAQLTGIKLHCAFEAVHASGWFARQQPDEALEQNVPKGLKK